jgi:hypothetical protein
MTIYHWFILFLAFMFAIAAMLELRSKLVSATMAFTSILCIGVLLMGMPAGGY